jgi:hypothetical protein
MDSIREKFSARSENTFLCYPFPHVPRHARVRVPSSRSKVNFTICLQILGQDNQLMCPGTASEQIERAFFFHSVHSGPGE